MMCCEAWQMIIRKTTPRALNQECPQTTLVLQARIKVICNFNNKTTTDDIAVKMDEFWMTLVRIIFTLAGTLRMPFNPILV